MDTVTVVGPSAAAIAHAQAGAEKAAGHLRLALERVGFLVERDFELWVPEVTGTGLGVVRVGKLSVGTADRLWQLVERCSARGLRVARGTGPAVQRPARVCARHRVAQVPEDARRAAARLRTELMRVGFVIRQDFGGCVAEVTASGLGLVLLGRPPAATAHLLANLIGDLDRAAGSYPSAPQALSPGHIGLGLSDRGVRQHVSPVSEREPEASGDGR